MSEPLTPRTPLAPLITLVGEPGAACDGDDCCAVVSPEPQPPADHAA